MTAPSEPPPLKTDALGRVHATAEYREALLDAFEQSSLSGMKFAAAHGVKYPTFASWAQKRRRERDQYQAESAPASLVESLVELELPAPQKSEHRLGADGSLRIQHSSGLLLCVDDARQAKLAAIVLRELNSTVPC